MATEYSLLTWAGLGTTVTFTDAGDIVNFTAHGAPTGHKFRFMTGSTLPTELTANTLYYLRVGADANKFLVYPTLADATNGTNRVTFTGTGSGTHKVIGDYWYTLDTAGRARYGTAGSERVYGTMLAFDTAIVNTLRITTDVVLEFWDKYKDTSVVNNSGFSGQKSVTLTTKINGARSNAYHNKVVGGGYVLEINQAARNLIYANTQPNLTVDGLEIRNIYPTAVSTYAAVRLDDKSPNALIINNILSGNYGVSCSSSLSLIANNIILDCKTSGFYESASRPVDTIVAFNLAHNNAIGFESALTTSIQSNSVYIGNISTGNTKNWSRRHTQYEYLNTSRIYATLNFGDATDLETVVFENSASPGTLTCRLAGHGFYVNAVITFIDSSGAVAPTGIVFGTRYYIKAVATDTFTLSAIVLGTAIAYTNSGSGTMQISRIWDTPNVETRMYINSTDFVNYANDNFYPATITSPQVNLIPLSDGDGLPRYDIADALRPNYNPDTTPWNATAGPFEFDTGYGLSPNFQDFTITGLISGSRVKIKKTSDGTVIHNAVVNDTLLTISYNAGTAATPVTIDIAKGNAAPFYYRYRTTSSISHLGASGVSVAQIADIARGASYPAGVATDWAVNTTTKVISNASGTTVYTVQDLYSWLCDHYDHADRVDLDMPMYGTTPNIFGSLNGSTISDAHMQLLNGGSFMAGSTLWANVYTVASKVAGTNIYIHVDGILYTAYWSTGDIDVLLKLGAYDGTEVIDVRAHNYSDTYDHWQMTVGEGRNVAAIATTDDPNNQTASGTVATWTDITITVDNPVGYAIDGSDTPANYTGTINCNNRSVEQVYERCKYLTVNPSVYVSANASFPEVKAAPYGTLSGGVFSVAQGWRLINVPTADTLNYTLTDNAGLLHQVAAPLGYQSVTITGGVAGTILQIRDMTSSTDLYLGTPSVWPHVWEDTNPYVADRQIRLRAMYCSGATAYVFFDQVIGTSTSVTPAVSYLLAQELDAVYNTNAVTGSGVTGVTIVDGTLRVQVSTGSISWQQLYAYETYWLSTAAGIIDEGRFAEATDVANYRWFDFKLKNTTSPSVPLVVTGGYGVDGDTGTSLAMLDTTGGTIILAPDHVVPYSSGAEATVAIVQAGLTAQGFTTTRAPKLDTMPADLLAAASTTPISANIKAVNGTTINGYGTEAAPWGP